MIFHRSNRKIQLDQTNCGSHSTTALGVAPANGHALQGQRDEGKMPCSPYAV